MHLGLHDTLFRTHTRASHETCKNVTSDSAVRRGVLFSEAIRQTPPTINVSGGRLTKRTRDQRSRLSRRLAFVLASVAVASKPSDVGTCLQVLAKPSASTTLVTNLAKSTLISSQAKTVLR